MILQAQVKTYMARLERHDTNKSKACALICGQCTQGLKLKLEARKDWDEIKKNNPIKLLNAIKEIAHNYQDNTYPIASIADSIHRLVTLKQGDDRLVDYISKFKNAGDVMEAQHGKFSMEGFVKSHRNIDSDHELTAEEACDRCLAHVFIKSVDQEKSGKLAEDLTNA